MQTTMNFGTFKTDNGVDRFNVHLMQCCKQVFSLFKNLSNNLKCLLHIFKDFGRCQIDNDELDHNDSILLLKSITHVQITL